MPERDQKPKTPHPGAPARVSSPVLAIRVLLLLLAAVAAASAFWIGGFRDRAPADSGARYACPMHPEVASAVPAQCPICGMDLERLASVASLATSGRAAGSLGIDSSTYLNYDVMRRRGTGPDAPAPAWVGSDGVVYAILYNDELDGLSPEARGTFYQAGTATAGVAVRATPGAPERWDRSTSRLRFQLDESSALSSGKAPSPGDVGRVRLIDKGRELPVIADSAILESADGPYVMVLSPDRRTLSKRPVQIGKVFAGLAFVLSGLGSRDLVLTRSSFFVDAERRLRARAEIEVRQ